MAESAKSTPEDKNREVMRCPEVIVDIIFEEGLFFIAVKNIGERPALRVSIRFEPQFSGVGGQVEVSALPLFENIEFLAPSKSIRTFLDVSTAYFERGEPSRISAQIFYYDRDGRQYRDTIYHDLIIYKDIGYIHHLRGNIVS